MTHLCNNLETERLGAHSNTAKLREYIQVGNILNLVEIFKGKDGQF
jgi:hypothetical protein